MILNRLANGITRQDWLAVTIEILVVVVGILLGLRANDWNDERIARIDEAQFLVRLHDDVLVTEELSARVMERRLSVVPILIATQDTLFNRSGRDSLLERECGILAGAGYFNINVSPLPSYVELLGTGRLMVIQSSELRSSLVKLQQAQEALSTLIQIQTTASAGFNLSVRYPDLIEAESFFDPEIEEIQSTYSCELTAMRGNRAFLNDFSVTADRYDAYISDGLEPWSDQLEKVHRLLDSIIGYEH